MASMRAGLKKSRQPIKNPFAPFVWNKSRFHGVSLVLIADSQQTIIRNEWLPDWMCVTMVTNRITVEKTIFFYSSFAADDFSIINFSMEGYPITMSVHNPDRKSVV